MKAVIIYFSNSGNTEKVAMRIKKDIGADLIKIIPEKEYGGYAISIAKMAKEKIFRHARNFTNDIPDLSEYDTVFAGYPIWAGGVPDIVINFLRKCDLKGKRIIPFSTAGASGINGSLKKLKAACAGGEIKYPLGITKTNRGDYVSWIEKIKN